eukprot:TRINITY_DN12462_c0_g1_i1.p1 TRINITY_DN12462_c0_g1~~TRINITY_DN12462_c0_g1_i1.p1  ORF type:complete len:347 (+),score=98.72 TRINITY_DN12462_c0_g1_i1:69-1109(+)
MAGISEGEVAVYDRQLRLWGVQAQQRLLKSKVLLWGLEGSNVELCKNLVLAGIALTVRDHREVSPAAVSFNYFLRPEDMGKNRAPCAAARIQEMNPLCSVSSSDGKVEADAGKLAESLKGFHVVCLSLGVLDWDIEKAKEINAACRKSGTKFFLSVGAGEMAMFFSDMQEHTVQERSSAQGGGAGSTAAEAPQYEPETFSFPALSEFLECAPAALLKEKVDASTVLVALFFSFLRKCGGKALPEDANKFEDYCRSVNCLPPVDGVSTLGHAYRTFFVEPLMHVASVLGGLLAQEVIKAITQRDPPLVNTVCFNANTCAALVERIPAEKKVAPKRKAEEAALDLDSD